VLSVLVTAAFGPHAQEASRPVSMPTGTAAGRPGSDDHRATAELSVARHLLRIEGREARPSRSGARPALSSPAAGRIARAVGAPKETVAKEWPVIEKALDQHGMTDVRTKVAAAATVVTEVGTGFRPVNEHGSRGYFTSMYEGRGDLGNTRAGDGARFHGRGYIQLTGRANYRSYGERLGLPLEQRPGIALRPAVGARVLAQYFKERGIDEDARRGRWRDVRLKVNGGLNGWTTYRRTVSALLKAMPSRANG
jgi:predicted chitinase